MVVKAKICGLTNLGDAQAAVAAGADCLGFVFAAESKRRVTPDAVRAIVAALPAGPLKVGVFVNERPERVVELLAFCGLDVAQLHGDETPDMARHIGVHRVWKAITLRTPQDVECAWCFPAAALVVDAVVPGARGGTGVVADWARAAELAALRPVVLAGGLTPENVADAVRRVQPWAVDVSSGVEIEPGRKDLERVRRFIAAARGATPG